MDKIVILHVKDSKSQPPSGMNKWGPMDLEAFLCVVDFTFAAKAGSIDLRPWLGTVRNGGGIIDWGVAAPPSPTPSV